MIHSFFTLRDGMRVYTEHTEFNAVKPTFVFAHGGPGNGCWDFRYAAELLAQNMNVVIFDQRGVLRSDALNADFTSEQLIDDIDDIRAQCGAEKIVLCGHSYGGQLAARYAKKYAEHIDKLIYLGPSFNFAMSLGSVYARAKEIMSERGMDTSVIDAAISANEPLGYIARLADMPEEIQYDAYGMAEPPEEVTRTNAIEFTDEMMQKCAQQQSGIFAESAAFADYREYLKDISAPSLLIVGDNDPVCDDAQQTEFEKYPQNTKNTIFGAGHMMYMTHPREMVDMINAFMA